jgi:hypothetical protein
MHIAVKKSDDESHINAKAQIQLKEHDKKTLVAALCELRDVLGEYAASVTYQKGTWSIHASDFCSIHDKNISNIPKYDILEHTDHFKTSGFHHCRISTDDNVIFHVILSKLRNILLRHRFQVASTPAWDLKDNLYIFKYDIFICEKETKSLSETEFNHFMKECNDRVPTVDDWRVRQDIIVYAQRKLGLLIQPDSGGISYAWHGNTFRLTSTYSVENTKRIFAKLLEIFSDKAVHIDGTTLTVMM